MMASVCFLQTQQVWALVSRTKCNVLLGMADRFSLFRFLIKKSGMPSFINWTLFIDFSDVIVCPQRVNSCAFLLSSPRANSASMVLVFAVCYPCARTCKLKPRSLCKYPMIAIKFFAVGLPLGPNMRMRLLGCDPVASARGPKPTVALI